MRRSLLQNRGETSLKEMPHPRMSRVIRLCIVAIDLAHPERQISVQGFEQEMLVIVHQALGIAQPTIPINDMPEHGEWLRPVTVVHNDTLPGNAPTGDSIGNPRKLVTQRTGLWG